VNVVTEIIFGVFIGAIGAYTVLPRQPGYSLGVTPPGNASFHKTLLLRARGWFDRFVDSPLVIKLHNRWRRFISRMSIIESHESFVSWWRVSADDERRRAYVGRRRRRVEDDANWRRKWARYPTQWWPTLSTTGDAADVLRHIVPELYFDLTPYDVATRAR